MEGGWTPAVSRDGRYVAFVSADSNLLAGDTTIAMDVLVHDRQTGVTTRANLGPGGVKGNGETNAESAIFADGRFVAFSSFAANLVAGDTNGVEDVFVRSR